MEDAHLLRMILNSLEIKRFLIKGSLGDHRRQLSSTATSSSRDFPRPLVAILVFESMIRTSPMEDLTKIGLRYLMQFKMWF